MESTVSSAVAGNNLWIVAVNLVIWTGLFFLLLRLDTRLRAVERAGLNDASPKTPS